MTDQPNTSAPKNSSKKQNVTNNIYLTKPARRQVKKGGAIRHEFSHHSSDYNIWYHKKLGDRFDKEERVKAATRCCVARDSGYTKADRTNKDTFICIYFARGHCMNGAECSYHHRIPTIEDELKMDLTHDIFGRERHRAYRDDMGGVGSFSRENKTLYVSGLKRTANLDMSVTTHFAEWGDLTDVKVVWDKSIAFVRFKLRCSAEFAKEAMTDQSLDGDEVLSIRWSNEDPNPAAKEREEQELYMELAKRVAEKQQKEEPMFTYKNPDGAEAPAADVFPSQLYANQYPNTDDQYSGANSTPSVQEWLSELGLQAYADSFVSAGYYDLGSVAQLDEYGLDAVGVVDLDHRTKLLENAAVLAQTMFPGYSTNESQYLYTNAEYSGADPNDDRTTQQVQPTKKPPKQTGGGLVDYEAGSDED